MGEDTTPPLGFTALGKPRQRRAHKFPRGTSLALAHPDIAALWHPTRNGDITPADVSRSTSRVVWWQCPNGHVWQQAVNDRNGSTACGFCTGKRIAPETSLAGRAPTAAAMWSHQNPLPAIAISPTSKDKALWECTEGHHFEEYIFVMVRVPRCPECPRVTIRPRFKTCRRERTGRCERRCRCTRDGIPPAPGTATGRRPSRGPLSETDPELAESWHPTLNGDLTAEQVTRGQRTRVWWLCTVAADHQPWLASIEKRVYAKNGCPDCWRLRRADSRTEANIRRALARELGFHPDRHVVRTPSGRMREVDAIHPSKRCIVEFDGAFWHAGESMLGRDLAKTIELQDAGWTVVRIRQHPLQSLHSSDLTIPATPQSIDADIAHVVTMVGRLLAHGQKPPPKGSAG